MSEVTISINGRGYALSCDDGQEERLKELGRYVNSRLNDIAHAGAADNESHLFVLTALVLADEIFDLKTHLSEMDAHIRSLEVSQDSSERGEYYEFVQEEMFVAQAIENLAGKIDHIAERIQKA